jgi:hypothetical protein
MSYELRPLSLAELLDRAFGLYRRHFLLFVGIMALPSVVMLVFSIALQVLQSPMPSASAAEAAPSQFVAFAAGVVAAFGIWMILYWIAYAVALGATTAAVADIYKGHVPAIGEAYRAMRGKVGRLALLMLLLLLRLGGVFVGVMLLSGILIGLSAALSPIIGVVFLIPLIGLWSLLMIWMLLRYSVCVAPAVLEDTSASESIARSIELTRGSLLRVLVIGVFTVIVTYAALAVFQFPFMMAAAAAGPETSTGFWLNMTGVITGTIASALTSPLVIVAMAVLYYDLRIRKEGLDIELLVAGLRARTAPSATLQS